MHSVVMLDRGMVPVPGDGADVTGFHHTTHNSAQLKMYELLISAIFSFNIVRWRLTLGNKL